jgi:hypothetical protein
MRFRITATLTGDGVSPEAFEVASGEIRVGVAIGEKGAVTQIWADLPVIDYGKWLPAFTIGQGVPHRLTFNDPPQAERLVAMLQYLESLGSFWLGIHRIGWGDAKREWIAETPDEKTRVSVFSISSNMIYQRRPMPFQATIVRELLQHKETKDWLTIPLSFYREGLNDHGAHRYINAFYNFYFFLEDLFGEGKTKNRQVLEAFRASPELKAAVLSAYAQCNSERRDLRPALDSLIGVVGGDRTADGLLEFLVMMRGELHHFSRKSSRPKGHPLNQAEFQPVSFFAMAICLAVIPKLITQASATG